MARRALWGSAVLVVLFTFASPALGLSRTAREAAAAGGRQAPLSRARLLLASAERSLQETTSKETLNPLATQCGTTSPCARDAMGMAWDGSSAQNVVLFGGSDSADNSLDDTWTWDGQGWHFVVPNSTSPCARHSMRMIYDGNGHVVLFGGIGPNCPQTGVQQDTWLWNGPQQTWTQWCPTCTMHPGARHSQGMTWDQTVGINDVVLFGGNSAATDPPETGTPITPLPDTWIWNGSGTGTWTPKSPNPAPCARTSPTLAWSSTRNNKVV